MEAEPPETVPCRRQGTSGSKVLNCSTLNLVFPGDVAPAVSPTSEALPRGNLNGGRAS